MQKLLDFLSELDRCSIYFELRCVRVPRQAIMVDVHVPGERWEVEFFADEHLEVEVFRSTNSETGGLQGEEALARLFAEFSD